MKHWRKLLSILVAVPLLLIGLIVFVIFATLVIKHSLSQSRMQERQVFWTTELEKISPGSSLDRVTALFQENHITLSCGQQSAVVLHCTCIDTETYGFLPQWRIHFDMTFKEGKLVQLNKQFLGLGL